MPEKIPIFISYTIAMLPSPNELRERYAMWSDYRLFLVLHRKEQYTAQAVEIAREELGRRSVTVDQVDLFLERIEEDRKLQRVLSGVSLSFREKVLCFFFWFAPSFFRLRYGENGFRLKMRQSQVFVVAGFVTHLAAAVAALHFRFGLLPVFALLIPSFFVFWVLERTITYDLEGDRPPEMDTQSKCLVPQREF